jgi:hypothetical protein
MLNDIIDATEQFLNTIRMERDENPTRLFNLMDEQRNLYESLQKKCRELILAQKKQEHFQTLLEKKNLGIP